MHEHGNDQDDHTASMADQPDTALGGAQADFDVGREAMHAAPRATSKASPTGAGAGAELPPLPNYLRGLVSAGAFEEDELRAIPHRRAKIRFQGEHGAEVSRPLAHLAPDALATIQRLTGGGHIVGVLECDDVALNFALETGRDPAHAAEAENPRVTALERAVTALMQKLEQPSELDNLGRVLVAQAIKRATAEPDAYGEIDRVIDSVGKLLNAGAKINAFKQKLAPVQQAAVEAAEGKPGALQRLLDRIATPERVDAMVEGLQEWALRKAGAGVIDADVVNKGGEDEGSGDAE